MVMELVNNLDIYLQHQFLGKGSSNSKELELAFTSYSPEFKPGMNLRDQNAIRNILQGECLTVIHPGAYMGIWQMYALSSVLHTPVQSVYPTYGGSMAVRSHIHRVLLPTTVTSNGAIPSIMWTSTSGTTCQPAAWIPNHFALCLPAERTSMNISW